LEALAKSRAWEGQRPRCPIRRRAGNEDVAPPGFCKCLAEEGSALMLAAGQLRRWYVSII
jgi:hypothetical protein